jgi:hypothetical protein
MENPTLQAKELIKQNKFHEAYKLLRRNNNDLNDEGYFLLGKLTFIIKGKEAALYWLRFSKLIDARQFENKSSFSR